MIAILSGSFGMICMAMLAVGGDAEEHETAERRIYTLRKDFAEQAKALLRLNFERAVVDRRLHDMRAERRLLRGMALGDGEDV
ncbi:MAG: hypothetical protein WC047_00185 [Kiritimatiellales bacterium]